LKTLHKRLKLHIDGRMLYMSGIGRCLREILKELVKDGGIDISLSGREADYNKYIDEYDIDPVSINFIKYDRPIYSVSEQFIGSWNNLNLKNKYDVFYYPHYNLPFLINENSIFTIHDFTQFKFPQYFGKSRVKIARMILNNAVKKANKIITVSESTKKDFYQFFPDYDKEIKVIHNGISENFRVLTDEERKSFKQQKNLDKYILFVGNNKPHKNIDGLVRAFKHVREIYPDFKLVIISSGYKINNRGIVQGTGEDIIIINGVTEEELILYYNCAFMMVLPSFYEGFGLPIIEAMACGCPVVTSDVSSMPECGGDAAVYFSPYDNVSIYKAMKMIIEDKKQRILNISKGYKRIKSFTWEVTARKYTHLLREI
jgi:glycosyltransferase involved in cell wall biosynthesis